MFEETLRGVAFALVRFSSFAANGLLFGLVPVILLVLRPSLAALPDDTWGRGRTALGVRLEGLVQAAIVTSVVATGIGLLLQAILVSEIFGNDLGTDSFRSVFDTSFGGWYLARFPLLAALAILLVGRVRSRSLAGTGDAATSPSPLWWSLWAALALGMLATSTFSGHAAVAVPRSVALINDIVHLAAGGTWFAGIVILAIALPDSWRGRDSVERLHLLAPAVARFSNVALVSIAVVAGSGTLASFLHIGAFNDLFDTSYGRTLALKIAVFLAILALGAVNHYVLSRRLIAGMEGAEPSRAQRLFRKTIAVELVIALTIFGLTGILTGLARTR